MQVFTTSENILNWSPSLFQNSPTSEIFAYVKKGKTKKLGYYESELDAIERVKDLKEIHQSLGIVKSKRFYEYAKLAFMEQTDKGEIITDEHFFKDTLGENLFISYN